MWRAQILVVDDCKEWREKLRSMLEAIPYCEIVGEACDALEAIEKATQLRPHMVLLDIGMPVLNGIEAAPRIRQASPNSKIVFVTQESDLDIRTAAIATGAKGYLLKSRVVPELVPTVEALLKPKPPQTEDAPRGNGQDDRALLYD